MTTTEDYVRRVMHNIQAPPQTKARIETDLRAHLQAALEDLPVGASPAAVVERMGDPVEVAEAFMSGITLRYATIWQRLAAFLIDVVICALGILPFAALGMFLSNLVPQHPAGPDYFIGALLLTGVAGASLAAVGIGVLYFPILEGRFGQTLGKRLWHLRVVKENGVAIGYKEALLRRIPLYFNFTFIDAVFMPFTQRRQRAFDIVARTIVIQER